MPRKLKPIPKTIVEVQQENFVPYEKAVGKPPISDNRGRDISRKNDNIQDISISLEDIDKAIMFYFENTIKPQVVQNNTLINVPIIYGSPERWKSVQNDGFYRDKNGKLMAPLIMFKRDSIEKNRNLGNKLDGNKSHLFQVFETRYNAKNQYDKFSLLNNRVPNKQFYVSVVPDYVTISYNCIVFTDFIEQNNKLIESIEFASDSYWGDFKRFHFKSKIDNFSVTNIIEQGSDRTVRTNFNLTVNGYIIPDSVNKEIAGKSMYYSTSQVVFGLESVGDAETTYVASSQLSTGNTIKNTSFIGDGLNINNTYNITNYYSGSGVWASSLQYLNNSIPVVTSNVSGSDTAYFNGVNISQPPSGSGLPSSSLNNFTFFINGQFVENQYISDFQEIGSDVRVMFNTGALGYSIE